MSEREQAISSLEELNEIARSFLAEMIKERGLDVKLDWPRIVKKKSFFNLGVGLSGCQILLHPDGRLTAKGFSRRSLNEKKKWLEGDLYPDEYLQYVGDALLTLIESDKRADDTPDVVVI